MSYYYLEKSFVKGPQVLHVARSLLKLQINPCQSISASIVMIQSLGFRKPVALLAFGVATIGLAMAAPAGATIITFDLGSPDPTSSSTQSVYTVNGYTLTVDNPLPSGSLISQTNQNGVCTYSDYFTVRNISPWCGQTSFDLTSTKWTISLSAPAVQLISYDLKGITTSSTANNGINDTAAVFTTTWTGDSIFTNSQNLSGGALGHDGTGATVTFTPGIFATNPFTVTTTSTTAGSLSYRIKTLTVLVPAPSPLPILGGAAALAYSRKLRSRIKASR
ncbi:MAG: hypothetical protein ACO3B3_01750 [Cyanobium sp.]